MTPETRPADREAVAEPDVGPVLLALIAGVGGSIVAEMTEILRRTARSPVLAIGNDFSNAVFGVVDGRPEMVFQGEDQPVHLGGMLVAVKDVALRFGDDVRGGDVIVRNDPRSGGSHLPDVDVIAPVVVGGEVVAWVCSRAHMGDIGGPEPGGFNPDAEDVFAEGLIISPVKLVDAGEIRDDVWDLLLANVRTPDLQRGDMGAQMSAVAVASRRLRELCERHGSASVGAAFRALLDRAERMARDEIRALPDGTYSGSAPIQDDGHGSSDAVIGCEIEISGDTMAIKVVSPPVCASYRNCYPGSTIGAIYLAFLTVLPPGLPVNEGLYRPLDIDLGPEGTMLNARMPAACGLSTCNPWENLVETLCDAFAQCAPHRAFAGWSHVCCSAISGVDPRHGEPYGGLVHATYQGGAGAVHGLDGGPLWGTIAAAGAPQVGDVEVLESRMPLRIHRYEFATDSGCPGRWRGGLGATLELEILDHEATVSHFGDGTKFPPPSRLDGGTPADGERRLHRKALVRDGVESILPLHSVAVAPPGTRLVVETSGGGGVGPARERSTDAVARDVRDGVVTVESARDEYGVALEAGTFEVDEIETARLREGDRS